MYPSGTVFSMSFGVTEQTFGGATNQPTKKFDSVFQKGIAKGDTFFASSGDSGSQGVSKQHRDTVTYPYATDGWPASSPYVTSVGGTQLQFGWRWNPQSDVSFTSAGDFNAPYWQTTPDASPFNVVWNESWLPAATGGVLVYTSFFPAIDRVGWHVYGGTSASSPQVAALTALAVQRAGHGLGNINAAIYANPGAFTDVRPARQGSPSIISGDLSTNRMFDYNGDGLPVTWDSVTGWPTTPGYDMTTRNGTPNAAAYVAALGR